MEGLLSFLFHIAMHQVTISGTGLWVAPQVISNAELVTSYNAYAEQFNQQNAARLEAGAVAAMPPSSEEFILKASGIRQRYVIDKAGVLDPNRMRPKLTPRPDEQKEKPGRGRLLLFRRAHGGDGAFPRRRA